MSDEEIEEEILIMAISLVEKIQGIIQVPQNISKDPGMRSRIKSAMLLILKDNREDLVDSYKNMDSWCFHNLLLTFIMDMLVTSLNKATKMMTDFNYEEVELGDFCLIPGNKKII